MAIEHIKETDTLNQGRQKINEIMDQSNQSAQKVDDYSRTLEQGIRDAKQIAADAGDDAKQIAQNAGAEANVKADQAVADSKTAVETANRAVGTANQNKQEFDTLRNEFDELVAESGDSNPEIVQARTDTEGIKQPTLQARLTRDFGNRLTTADAIKMFSGSVNTPKMMDFSSKTAGNLTTNPHQGYSDYTATTLKKPAAAWNEVNQDAYNKLVARDDSGVSTGSTQNGVIPQQLFKFDVIKAIEQIAPTVFSGKSVEESIQLIKNNFVSFTLALRGKATSPNNKNLKVATYLESTDSYSTQLQSAAQEYTDFTTEINDRNFIDSKGKINVLVYSDSSNGVTSSNIDIDYVGVQIVVSLNPLDVLESSGFAKSENVTNQLKQHTDDKNNPHSVTKSQVGLGSVPNYGAATDAEALLGTVNNKMMTPKNVKDAIEAQSVLLEGNQDIQGIKNFEQIPTSLGEQIVSSTGKEMYITRKHYSGTGSMDSSIASRFDSNNCHLDLVRVGNIVFFYSRLKVASAPIGDASRVLFIPNGYKMDSSKFYNNQLIYPLTADKPWKAPTDNIQGYYEIGQHKIVIKSTTTGNIYWSGSWITTDPFPVEDTIINKR